MHVNISVGYILPLAKYCFHCHSHQVPDSHGFHVRQLEILRNELHVGMMSQTGYDDLKVTGSLQLMKESIYSIMMYGNIL
jgi:hypothetical protein